MEKDELEAMAVKVDALREQFRQCGKTARAVDDWKNHGPLSEALDFLEKAAGKLRCAT